MTSKPSLIFGRLGWILLIASILLMIGIAYFLPNILAEAELSMPDKWPFSTKIVVQITIGAWFATSVSSIARVVVWLRAIFVITTPTKYNEERRVVKLIRDFNLWTLGIMTTLAGYLTMWFSGG